jgi:hypothetical protein
MRCCTRSNRAARSLVAAGLAVAAVVGVVAFGSTDAAAGFNVTTFQCTSNPGQVDLDVSGLGNTNICVEGTFVIDSDCACVGGGGNCTSDAKKNSTTTVTQAGVSVEAKNGRVDKLVTVTVPSATCSDLSCPNGQTARAIIQTTDGSFTLCKTSVAGGGACSCDPAEGGGEILAEIGEGDACDTSAATFPGKHNSCANLDFSE